MALGLVVLLCFNNNYHFEEVITMMNECFHLIQWTSYGMIALRLQTIAIRNCNFKTFHSNYFDEDSIINFVVNLLIEID